VPGGAAIILCFPAGQIALGAPRPKTKSNGELTLCDSMHLVDAAARRVLHSTHNPSHAFHQTWNVLQAARPSQLGTIVEHDLIFSYRPSPTPRATCNALR